MLSRTAWAKINLTLHVTGRRADGYHDIDSLVVFAGVGDRLTFAPDDRLTLEVDGPFAGALSGESTESRAASGDNLVLRAARALQDRFAVTTGARMHLTKRLPVAAGIGGGSADAAAALLALAELWGLSMDPQTLAQIGGDLGADIPVCLRGRPSLIGGKGDRIADAPSLPPMWLVLANPGVALATAQVFAGLAAPYGRAAPRLEAVPDAAALARYLAGTRNDLEPAARQRVPAIGDLLGEIAATDGCVLARMSGSGATCFGLYATHAAADAAADALRTARPGHWVRAAPMRPGPEAGPGGAVQSA